MFTCLTRGERDERTNGQIENIMPAGSLAWWRIGGIETVH